jgi:hypothetical protein
MSMKVENIINNKMKLSKCYKFSTHTVAFRIGFSGLMSQKALPYTFISFLGGFSEACTSICLIALIDILIEWAELFSVYSIDFNLKNVFGLGLLIGVLK